VIKIKTKDKVHEEAQNEDHMPFIQGVELWLDAVT
jgi:hypothetical protein